MAKLGRPKKYATPEEFKAEMARKAREKYHRMKKGDVRPYEKYDDIKEHRYTPWYRAYYLARKRAEKKGWDFDIDINFLCRLYQEAKECPIFNIPFGDTQENKKSLDRFDSTKGYTKDNVWIISMKANVMKREYSAEALKVLADGLMKFKHLFNPV